MLIQSPVTFFRYKTLRKSGVSRRSRHTRVSSENEEPCTGQVTRGRVSEVEDSMCRGSWEDTKLRENVQMARVQGVCEHQNLQLEGQVWHKSGREEVPTTKSTLT